MEGNDVDEEDISAPGGDHVEVGQRAEGRPVHVARLHRLDPEVVGEQHAEDGNALVIIGPGHRPVGERDMVRITMVMWIRIGCNAEPNPGSASASIWIRIQSGNPGVKFACKLKQCLQY